MSRYDRSSGSLPDGCTVAMLPGNQDRMSLAELRFMEAQRRARQEIERKHKEQARVILRNQRGIA